MPRGAGKGGSLDLREGIEELGLGVGRIDEKLELQLRVILIRELIYTNSRIMFECLHLE